MSLNQDDYRLLEAQNASDTTPLVLWLNGGPGCSSLGGLILENGPYRQIIFQIYLFFNS